MNHFKREAYIMMLMCGGGALIIMSIIRLIFYIINLFN